MLDNMLADKIVVPKYIPNSKLLQVGLRNSSCKTGEKMHICCNLKKDIENETYDSSLSYKLIETWRITVWAGWAVITYRKFDVGVPFWGSKPQNCNFSARISSNLLFNHWSRVESLLSNNRLRALLFVARFNGLLRGVKTISDWFSINRKYVEVSDNSNKHTVSDNWITTTWNLNYWPKSFPVMNHVNVFEHE